MIIVPGAAGEIGCARAPRSVDRNAQSWLHARARERHRGARVRNRAGFFQVLQDRAIALVDDAVEAAKIDHTRAQEQLEAAQAELEAIDSGESTATGGRLEQRIRHAENQLAVAGRA